MNLWLYQCRNCRHQYVVEHGIIRCPYCQSKERDGGDALGLEDINDMLLQLQEAQEREEKGTGKA